MLFKTFQKIKKEGTFLNSSYEANIVPRVKLQKHSTNKENYRQTFLINIDAKIFNKILTEFRNK